MTPPAAAAPAVRRARTVAPGRPLTPSQRPRRVSGPARRKVEPSRRATPQGEGLVVGLLAALRSVDDSPLLDRLIRGRAWIAIMAFALIGIVTLQLGLLQLNAGIGRALAQETSLERQNAALNIENSERASGDLVESSATAIGMELVRPADLRFLTPNPSSDVARAASALHTPVAGSSTGSSSGSTSSGESATSGSSVGSTATSGGEATSATGAQAGESTGAATPQGSTPADEAGSAAGASTTSGSVTSTTSSAAPAGSSPSTTTGAGESHTAEIPATSSTAPATGAGSSGASEAQGTPVGGTQAGG